MPRRTEPSDADHPCDLFGEEEELLETLPPGDDPPKPVGRSNPPLHTDGRSANRLFDAIEQLYPGLLSTLDTLQARGKIVVDGATIRLSGGDEPPEPPRSANPPASR